MKKLGIVCLIAVCLLHHNASGAAEWRTVVRAGQDDSWYTAANWSGNAVPLATDTVEWRYASATSTYSPLVISGGTAYSAASTCGIWYTGMASLTVTNGAVYNINGATGLNLYNSASTALTGVNSVFTVNGGSKVNITTAGYSQIGRKMFPAAGASGQSVLNIDGANTEYTASGYTALGWSAAGSTQSTFMNVTHGAVATFTTTGGLMMGGDNISLVKITLDDGTIKIRGNRTAQWTPWIGAGLVVGYDGTKDTVTMVYDSVNNFTILSSIPEPATLALLSLGAASLLGRKRD